MIGLTGATGFIGKALYNELIKRKIPSRFYTRSKNYTEKNFYHLNYFEKFDDWKKALDGIQCIIHCAGIAGNVKGSKKSIYKIYERSNVETTYNIAYAAANLGVKRFIYLSSAKIIGENTKINQPFKINDPVNPSSYYSQSKFKAEQKLLELSKKYNLEIVIIRIPPVYGFLQTGNIKKLASLIKMGIPLPLDCINNKRSFISLENLIDFILLCTKSPDVINEIFLISDDNDISTTDLVKIVANDLNKSAKLFYLSPLFLKILGYFSGNSKIINQLIGSFQIDISYTKEKTGWIPKKMISIK